MKNLIRKYSSVLEKLNPDLRNNILFLQQVSVVEENDKAFFEENLTKIAALLTNKEEKLNDNILLTNLWNLSNRIIESEYLRVYAALENNPNLSEEVALYITPKKIARKNLTTSPEDIAKKKEIDDHFHLLISAYFERSDILAALPDHLGTQTQELLVCDYLGRQTKDELEILLLKLNWAKILEPNNQLKYTTLVEHLREIVYFLRDKLKIKIADLIITRVKEIDSSLEKTAVSLITENYNLTALTILEKSSDDTLFYQIRDIEIENRLNAYKCASFREESKAATEQTAGINTPESFTVLKYLTQLNRQTKTISGISSPQDHKRKRQQESPALSSDSDTDFTDRDSPAPMSDSESRNSASPTTVTSDSESSTNSMSDDDSSPDVEYVRNVRPRVG